MVSICGLNMGMAASLTVHDFAKNPRAGLRFKFRDPGRCQRVAEKSKNQIEPWH
jgi:hypothetical protein